MFSKRGLFTRWYYLPWLCHSGTSVLRSSPLQRSRFKVVLISSCNKNNNCICSNFVSKQTCKQGLCIIFWIPNDSERVLAWCWPRDYLIRIHEGLFSFLFLWHTCPLWEGCTTVVLKNEFYWGKWQLLWRFYDIVGRCQPGAFSSWDPLWRLCRGRRACEEEQE